MTDLLREIFQTLKCNKLRTSLTGLAVAWGIFMLITLVGMTKGVINSFEKQTASQGSNTINVWPGVTSEPWHGYREGRDVELRTGDMEKLRQTDRQKISDVSSSVYGGGTISTAHEYTSSGYEGVYPSEQRRRGFKMAAGRFINDIDMNQKRKVMVLGEQMVPILFPNKTPAEVIGEKVDCQGLGWTVVGVYESRWSRSVYIPFSTARMLAGNSDKIGSIVVEMTGVETESQGTDLENDIRATLAAAHDFRPTDQSAVWTWNRFTQFLKMQSGMGILNTAMWIIGIFTLLSGIVGVSNIMFVSVRERTHEIGIRRAIGARPRSILTQVIMESVAITSLFGYIGILMGIGLTELLARIFDGSDFITDPRVDISLALEVTAVLIIAGALAGLFPAINALKVKPVEALRDE